MEHIKFYDNPENISPKEILEKMMTLGYGPNRNKRFYVLSLYEDKQITKEEWIIKYTTK